MRAIKTQYSITVLMSVYNDEEYVCSAVESILNQTFTDFEFLIINDASTDESRSLIQSYDDPRIRLIDNDKNIGLAASLNKGLKRARGKYIARMDADDISHPKRLEKQFAFMEKCPEIGVVSTWGKIIGKKHRKYNKTPVEPENIKATLLFKNALIHSVAMLRKDMFDAYNLRYNEDMRVSQDYELWSRTVLHFPLANIPEFLIFYRMHGASTTKRYSERQRKYGRKTRLKQLKRLDIEPTEEEAVVHTHAYAPDSYDTEYFISETEKWFLRLIEQNQKTGYVRESHFSAVVASQWLYRCSINAQYQFSVFKRFWFSSLRRHLEWRNRENLKMIIRFFLKCLFKRT